MKTSANRSELARRCGSLLQRLGLAFLALGAVAGSPPIARGEELGDRELAKAARNPLPDFIIVPIQSNTNLDYGPGQGIQDGINIQPLISFHLTPDWNVITRTVVPVIFNPDMGTIHSVAGVGDIQFTPFLSPSRLNAWTWGVGPVIQIPTHTHPTLGNANLGLGPAFAAFHMTKGNPWVVGVLANTAWSLGTNPYAPSYSVGSLQPLISYHINDGLYLTSSPIIKANWLAPPDHQILLPLGGGIGKILHLGNLPVNAELSAYYNVMKRDFDADWQLRIQLQFLFPKPH